MNAPTPLIAFHLPQFHPIPENDRWWGAGFTEWRNVAKARPLWRDQHQPILPADLGFYDLRLPEVRAQQAAMARAYGIDAFCYYHYWFNGKQLLERPVEEIVASGEPDFPFLLCWANEQWTRAWDGMSREVLIAQEYSPADDRAHIRSLLPKLGDRRYVRIDGRVALLVYRAGKLPEPRRTADVWRDEVRRAGLGELLLLRVQNYADEREDPATIGFDAAVEFMPDQLNRGRLLSQRQRFRKLQSMGLWGGYPAHMAVHDYQSQVDAALAKPDVPYTRYRCVTPRWDNTARRPVGGVAFVGSTPAKYERWLEQTLRTERGKATASGTQRPVFINAWNEWAEGAHLEPDARYGHQYLEATRAARAAAGGAKGLDG